MTGLRKGRMPKLGYDARLERIVEALRDEAHRVFVLGLFATTDRKMHRLFSWSDRLYDAAAQLAGKRF